MLGQSFEGRCCCCYVVVEEYSDSAHWLPVALSLEALEDSCGLYRRELIRVGLQPQHYLEPETEELPECGDAAATAGCDFPSGAAGWFSLRECLGDLLAVEVHSDFGPGCVEQMCSPILRGLVLVLGLWAAGFRVEILDEFGH